MLGFEVDGQERIFETSLVQNGGFVKAQGTRTCGQEELLCRRRPPRWGCEGWLITYLRGEMQKKEVSKEFLYAKEDLQGIRGLAIVK